MLAPALVLALLAATPALAAAPELREGSVTVSLKVPGADAVCVVRPVALRDPAACEGVDVEAADAAMPPQVVAYSFQTMGEGDLSFHVSRTPRPKGELDEKSMRVFVQGAHKGISRAFPGATTGGLVKGTDFDAVKSADGSTLYRFVQVLPEGANDGYDRTVTYVGVSGEHLYTLRFELPAPLFEKVVPATQKLVAGMRLTAAPAPKK